MKGTDTNVPRWEPVMSILQVNTHIQVLAKSQIHSTNPKPDRDSTLNFTLYNPKNDSFQFATQMLTAFPIQTVQAPAGDKLLQLQFTVANVQLFFLT